MSITISRKIVSIIINFIISTTFNNMISINIINIIVIITIVIISIKIISSIFFSIIK
jgi:hypothetical protein